MVVSTVEVATPNASRYLQQLCKHWSHRFAVTFNADQGAIDFGDGKTVSLTARADVLEVQLAQIADEDLGRMQDVVAEHIQRFATKEVLSFNWAVH